MYYTKGILVFGYRKATPCSQGILQLFMRRPRMD